MRRTASLLLLAFVVTIAGAQDFPVFFERAMPANASYQSALAALELARLDHERSVIESATDLDTLTAALALHQAIGAYRDALSSFYASVVDAVYSLARAEIALESAKLSESLAQTDVTTTRDAMGRGLASRQDVLNAEIDLRSASVDVAEAQWDRDDATEELASVTGASTTGELPQTRPPDPVPSLEAWLTLDEDVASGDLSARIAALRLQQLADNATIYDRTRLEQANDRARSAAERTRVASERSYRSLVRKLSSEAQIIGIREDEVRVGEALLADAKANYDSGMTTQSAVELARVRLYTAQSGLYQARQNYAGTVYELLARTQALPGDRR